MTLLDDGIRLLIAYDRSGKLLVRRRTARCTMLVEKGEYAARIDYVTWRKRHWCHFAYDPPPDTRRVIDIWKGA